MPHVFRPPSHRYRQPVWVPSAAVSAYETRILSLGPVMYLRLGEPSGTNANDETANNNDGTYVGTPTLGATGALFGDTDTALTLVRGASQYVTVGDSASIDTATGDSFTAEVWAKRAANTGDYETLISRAGSPGFHFLVDPNGKIQLWAQTGTLIVETASSLVTADATWHHIVLVKNGTTRLIYLDGADVTVSGTNATISTTTAAVEIGRDTTGSGSFGGDIDEVALYAGALSAADILENYETGTGAGGPVSYPQALDATVATVAAISRQTGKTLADAVATTGTISRQTGKTLTDSISATATLTKQAGKTLTATVATVATLAALRVFLRTLTATVATTASMTRQAGKILTDSISTTATMSRQAAKTLTDSIAAVASLTATKAFLKTMSATVATAASMSRSVGKTVTGTVTTVASMTAVKAFLKTVTATVATSASLTATFIPAAAAVVRRVRTLMGVGE